MKGGHLIYCISNANTDSYENTLSRFSNFLPTNLEISKRRDWEVRVMAFGLHLNVKEDFAFDVVQVKSDIVSSGPIGNSTIFCVADLPSSKNQKYFLSYPKERSILPRSKHVNKIGKHRVSRRVLQSLIPKNWIAEHSFTALAKNKTNNVIFDKSHSHRLKNGRQHKTVAEKQ